MTCYHPLKAYLPFKPNSEGKRNLIFSPQKHRALEYESAEVLYLSQENPQNEIDNFFEVLKCYDSPYNFPILYDRNTFDEKGMFIFVPCNHCIGCKLDYSRMWATRSVHEAYMANYFNDCAFLTLTFNDDMLYHRDNPYSLNKVAFRCFIKRLRKAVMSDYGKTFRFMSCGEYGSRRGRPHYHMLIYGFNFPDKYVYSTKIVHGQRIFYYRSPFLEKLWKPANCDKSFGFSIIGLVNYETSAYVARYVTKKLHKSNRCYLNKEQEFLLASRNKGLGYYYLEKFYKQIFDNGYITLPTGFKAPIPRYYYNSLSEIDPQKYYDYTIARQADLRKMLFVDDINKSAVRLKCKEELQSQRLDKLFRTYEFDTSEIARYGYVN